MRVLFLFLDGVGLGLDDPLTNPLAAAKMPHLQELLQGKRLLKSSVPLETPRATLLPLDAGLGVKGLPQSATGQAVLLTGQNVPALLGYHYGPKPNPAVAEFLNNGALFKQLLGRGLKAGFLNAYPPRYFEAVQSGRRLYSAIPMAAAAAGLPLYGEEDLEAERALSADFTGKGWREHLGLLSTPELLPRQAGQRLAALARGFDFAFFEYWLSDYAGHRQRMDEAVSLLETFDAVLEGLLEGWNDEQGVILITSDHGNLEDLSIRKHTQNPVPALLVGAPSLRKGFATLETLVDVAPAILNFLVNN